jgi:transcriptional regulator with XRE-family HTH domain
LCKSKGFKPQSKQIIEMLGVSSPFITGWSNGSIPKGDVLCKFAEYFNVSVDYLLGRTENEIDILLSDSEQELVEYYRSFDKHGKNMLIGRAAEIYRGIGTEPETDTVGLDSETSSEFLPDGVSVGAQV